MFATAIAYTTIAPGLHVNKDGWLAWTLFFHAIKQGYSVSVVKLTEHGNHTSHKVSWSPIDGFRDGYFA